MIQVCLDHAPRWLAQQTPKEYVQQLAAASEALRRSRVAGLKGSQSREDLLGEFRRVMQEVGS